MGDSLLNLNMLIVVSKSLKSFLQAQDISKMEFLPVSIVDQRGKVMSKEYSILHPLELIDCMDRSASEFEMDIIDPDSFGTISKLVLDESLTEDRKIFNMKGFWELTFVRRDLAEAISKKNFSNTQWQELTDYKSIG
ncbi:MAG TPA: DUF1629 domain-containing protein [Bdellovibrio sp.]|nr:DUF1629 domain-containing protein [Bdellovibrio sp.]